MKFLIRTLQLLFAITFIVSGLAKCIDPAGTALKFTEYLQYFGLDFLVELTMGMAWVLSIMEFMIGISLMLGTARIRTLFFASLLMLVFTPLTLWLAVSDAIQDCGCFGDAIHLTNWQTFAKNLVLDLVLVLFWCYRSHLYQLFGPTVRTAYGYWSFGIALWLCWLGTWSEPWIDFRPFHPGVSLRESIGQSASSSATTYLCIYEKDGLQQEFSLDELPDEADGWTFVDTREYTVEPEAAETPQQPPLDFYVKAQNDELVTEQLLADTSYTFVLLSPSLDQASEHDLDKIEALYEYALDHDYAYYCLTSRDSLQVKRWQVQTGAEYPILYTDAQIIETITRANPGLMLLHDGVICWKSRLSRLASLPISSAKLNEQTYGEIQYFDTRNHYFWLFLLLFFPIMLPLCIEFTKFIKVLTQKQSKNA